MPTKSTGGFVTVESLWPTSVGGWVGLIAGSSALVLLIVDRLTARGKNLAVIAGKLDTLCGQVDDFEGKLQAVDGLVESVRELTQEWRGTPGSPNGYRAIIRDNQRRLDAIEKRNTGIDAIRDEDERRGGGKHRRYSDRELNNLLPEDREERP